MDVAPHSPVPHAKDGALQPVLGHDTAPKYHVHAQEHDRGRAAVTAYTGGQSVHLRWSTWWTECILQNILNNEDVGLFFLLRFVGYAQSRTNTYIVHTLTPAHSLISEFSL